MIGYAYTDGHGDLFVSPYQEYFHVYNPLLTQEREAVLRRRMGEEQHLFGSEGEGGCCRRAMFWWCVGAILVVCTVGIVLLILHYADHRL
jgi:hypothetical protein